MTQTAQNGWIPLPPQIPYQDYPELHWNDGRPLLVFNSSWSATVRAAQERADIFFHAGTKRVRIDFKPDGAHKLSLGKTSATLVFPRLRTPKNLSDAKPIPVTITDETDRTSFDIELPKGWEVAPPSSREPIAVSA